MKMRSPVSRSLFVLVALLAVLGYGRSAFAQSLAFTAHQADAAWMPGATNLRWHDGHLEGLFFLRAYSADRDYRNLSVAITGAGADRTEPFAALEPLSEEQAAQIAANDATWFSIKSDVHSQQGAATRTIARLWLPVEPGRAVTFTLRQDGKDLAAQTLTPELVAPVWFRSQWKAAAEDPVLHGRVLYPHHNVLVQAGTPVALECEFVGTGADAVLDATLVTSVRAADAPATLWQQRDAVKIRRLAADRAVVTLPASAWAPGSYVVSAELQDASGKFVGSLRRGLDIVAPRTVASRFGATYANVWTPAAVNAKPEEESAYFKVPREYHATHMGPDSDVVVSFDGKSDHLVFSHLNRGYTPFWYVQGMGIDWEWVEGHDDQLGSLEVQYDPEARYARVSIVSSTPARAVIHWRYNTSSRYYDRYFDEWVDEFYTIYPDQTAVRKIMGYFRRHNWHETFEPYLVGPAGLHLGEVFEDKHLSWLNLNGGRIDMDPLNLWKNWNRDWTQFRSAQPADRTALLQFNLRGGQKFFYTFADLRRVYSLWSNFWWDGKTLRESPGAKEQPFPQDTETPSASALHSQVSSYCFFDAQAALLQVRSLPDGRLYSPGELERETNNKMSNMKDMADVRIESTYAFLLGLGDQVDPVAMSQSWVAPAVIANPQGAEFVRFESTERAYRLRAKPGALDVRFSFQPQAGKAQVNPVFVVDGVMDVTALQVSVGGKPLAADAYRIGFEAQSDGTQRVVVWTRQTLSAATDLRIAAP